MTNPRTIFIPLKSRLCTNCYGKRKVTQQPLVYINFLDPDGAEWPTQEWVTEWCWTQIAEIMGKQAIPVHPQFLIFKQINCPNCSGTGQEKYVDLSPLEHIQSSFPEGYFL